MMKWVESHLTYVTIQHAQTYLAESSNKSDKIILYSCVHISDDLLLLCDVVTADITREPVAKTSLG